MLRKYLFLVLVICMGFLFCSCKEEKKEEMVDIKNWNGMYVINSENTDDIRLLTIKKSGEKTLKATFESSEITETFSADVKSESGRMLVVNTKEKAITITAEEGFVHIEVDDMWTGEKIEDRKINWSGDYKRLSKGEKAPVFVKD